MRGAETSTAVLPCGRGVHLHNSASFETKCEQLQTNHTNDAKINSNTFETSVNKNIQQQWFGTT